MTNILERPEYAKAFMSFYAPKAGYEYPMTMNDPELRKLLLEFGIPQYVLVRSRELTHKRTRSTTVDLPFLIEFMEKLNMPERALIGFSQRSRESREVRGKTLPKTYVMFFDIEYFDHFNKAWLLQKQEEVIKNLELVFIKMEEVLTELGIHHLISLTGRGFHFYSVVDDPNIMYEISLLGCGVEPFLMAKQQHPESKKVLPIPLGFEETYRGMMIIQQYILNLVLKECQKLNGNVNVSDMGEHGVALDNTGIVRHTGTGKAISIPNSGSKAYIEPDSWGGDGVVSETPIQYRIATPSSIYQDGVGQYINTRNDLEKTLEWFKSFDHSIPQVNANKLREIINAIKIDGDLFLLINQLNDSNQLFIPSDTYQLLQFKYDPNNNIPDYLSELFFSEPNPKLLQPSVLEHIICGLYDQGWHPMKIVNYLHSFYADPNFNFWQIDRHNEPQRHAWGWVTIFLMKKIMIGP